MKRISLFLIVLALLAGTAAFADNHSKPMSDDDVIAMVKAGLPDDTIISAINAQSTSFDVSAPALVNLKNQGVSVKVIDAMLAASKKQGDGNSAPAANSNAPSSGAPPQREQFTPSANSNQQPANNSSSAGDQNSSSSQTAPGQKTNLFDKINQTQNALTGTVQQGQSNYQQIRSGMPGHQQNSAAGQAPGSYPGASVAPAANAQTATPGAYPSNPPAGNQPAAQARYQQQLRQQQQPQPRDLAARQAAMQQQRQQQVAAAQQRAAKVAACRQQALKAYPKGGPDFAKAYTSCIQAP